MRNRRTARDSIGNIGLLSFFVGKEAIAMNESSQMRSARSRIARAATCALASILLAFGLVPAQAFAENAEGGVLS